MAIGPVEIMKKILIISYNFAPRHTVGAIRPTKLAQYLSLDGYEVDVVAVKPFGELDHSLDAVFDYINHIDEIGSPIMVERSVPKNVKNSAPLAPKTLSRKDKAIKALKTEYRESKKIINSKHFAKDFDKLVCSDIKRFSSYDAFITTYGPVASHLCGLVMKKRCPDVKWIADFRDPMVFSDHHGWVKAYRASLQKKVCSKAEELVTISQGTFDEVFTDKNSKEKGHIIFNGFDRRDFDLANASPDGEFSFMCVGAMYAGRRDISVLLKVFDELIKENKLKKEELKIKYAGNNISQVLEQASKFDLCDCVTDFGVLSRADCLKAQASCRHLVLPNWNCTTAKGVLPGKFFEYMMVGRPIISVVCGDLPDSEISSVIKKGNLGISYEEARDKNDYPLLKKYIEEDIARFRNGEDCKSSPDLETVNKFDFSNTAKEFEKLI